MDPILVATVTAAVTVLAREVGKAAIGASVHQLWQRIAHAFSWKEQPKESDLAPEVAKRLLADAALTARIAAILKESGPDAKVVGALVARIDAQKVVVADSIVVHGDFKF